MRDLTLVLALPRQAHSGAPTPKLEPRGTPPGALEFHLYSAQYRHFKPTRKRWSVTNARPHTTGMRLLWDCDEALLCK
jgi:hypothetical protein